MLAFGDYRSSDLNTDWTDQFQPSSALTAIVLGFSLIPAVLILLSLVPLSRYSLDHASVEQRASALPA